MVYYLDTRHGLTLLSLRKTVILLVLIIGFGIMTEAKRMATSQVQDITGQWDGVLIVPGANLRIVFKIQSAEDGYKATVDSPDQGLIGNPVGNTSFDGSKVVLAITNLGALYEGELKADSITGTFKQGGMSFPLNLKRTSTEVKTISRPQEPKPPFPYRAEEVKFENKTAGVTLAGTLTLPETGNNFTAVILITGSGPQNRDEEISGHKPFLVIADYLTRRGIAVLRYDDRGTAQSTGNFTTSTTADFATDTESAIAYLKTRKEINPQKIGLTGHSEGGIIASMIAARSKDVSFIVMLAGPGLRGDALLLLQSEALGRAAGLSEDKIARGRKLNLAIYNKIVNSKEHVSPLDMVDFLATQKTELTEFIPAGMNIDNYIKVMAAQMTSPWHQYFLRYDPAPALEKVKCPVLAVIGSKDLQVPAKENLAAINAALKKGGNKDVITKEYTGLNHLFQQCVTGLPTEYGTIEQTFSPEVLQDIAEWIKVR